MTEKLRLHLILDAGDEPVVQAVKALTSVEVAQWDYSFDTAFQWNMHNEPVEIDVIFASEFAQISTTDEDGKKLPRDKALLRRVKNLRLMRPNAKFILLCDEDRALPENRHFLSELVIMGMYDFRTETTLTTESIKQMIMEPKRTIAHVQEFLPENMPAAKPFIKKEKAQELELKSVDIFAMMEKFKKKGTDSNKKPKVKHVIEKVRPAVVSFISFGSSDGDSSLLAQYYAVKLAAKEAKVALVELHSTGIPRIGFSTGVRSRQRTTETALQRIEDGEDISNILITPKEALSSVPGYESALAGKYKKMPQSLFVLGGKDNAMPHIPVFNQIKLETLNNGPGEIVNQLIFRHGFDCVVFVLAGNLRVSLNFSAMKVSNCIYCVTDQHPAHLSWLKQNLSVIEQLQIPLKNIRLVAFPYYELDHIRVSDMEAALGREIDYVIPDIKKELLNMAWYSGETNNGAAGRTIAQMVLEATGYKLGSLEAKSRRRFSLPKRAKSNKEKELPAEGVV